MNIPANDGVKPDRRLGPQVDITDYLSTGRHPRRRIDLRADTTKGSDHLNSQNLARALSSRKRQHPKNLTTAESTCEIAVVFHNQIPDSRLVFLLVITIFASGCAGSLFKVQPRAELPPMEGVFKSADAGGLLVRVAPLLEDEESQELFEANLPLSGVLPVRIEFEYQSGLPIEIRRARFRLHDSGGPEWKLLSTKAVISKIMKANGISLYNPESRKQFVEEFEAYRIDLSTPLSASDPVRQGFLFFENPTKRPIEQPTGLRLKIERITEPLEIEIS